MTAASVPSDSPFSPLRQPLFRALWIAAVVSNIGTWMQNVGGVWLMGNLTDSAFLIALMQAASSLPFFLLSLPAGALADLIDRRWLMVICLAWMAIAAGVLGWMTLVGSTTPASLLILTFALGMGNCMYAPAYQSSVPEITGRDELPKAVALSGVGYNIARVVGPGLGGLAIATLGIAGTFILNAVSFIGTIWVTFRWKRVPPVRHTPSEHIFSAIRSGMRYAKHSPVLKAILVRTGAFVFCASALWALLPIVARGRLGLGAAGYGTLVGCLGAGSLIAAWILPRFTRTVSIDTRLLVAGTAFAFATIVVAFSSSFPIVCLSLVVGGFGWLTTMVGVNVATQSAAPLWVQARALSLYVLVSQGGIALGSFFWGSLASSMSDSASLALAGLGLIAGLLTVYRWPLQRLAELDITMVSDWREPETASPLDPEDGPVLVTVDYDIDPARAPEFQRAMREIKVIRRRDGAIRWELFHDVARPGRFFEVFLVESWAEHVRQHARVIKSDVPVREHIRSFQIGDRPPQVSHLMFKKA